MKSLLIHQKNSSRRIIITVCILFSVLFQVNLYSQQRAVTNIPCSNDFISVYHYDGGLSTDPYGNYLGLIKYQNTSSNKLEYYLMDCKRGNTIRKSTINIPSIKSEESVYAYPRAPFVVIGVKKNLKTDVYFYEPRNNKIFKTVSYPNNENNAVYEFVINGRSYDTREYPGYWKFTVEKRNATGVEIDYSYKWANRNYDGKWKTYFDFLSRDFEVNFYLEKLQLIRFHKKQLFLYQLDINPKDKSYSGLKIYNIPNTENKSPDFAMARKDGNFFVTYMQNTASGNIEIYRFLGSSKTKQDDFWIFPHRNLNDQEKALHRKKTNDYFKSLNSIYTQREVNDKVYATNKGYFTYDFVYKVSVPYLSNGEIKYNSEAKIYRVNSDQEVELGPVYENISPSRKEKIKYEFRRKIEIEG